MKQICFRKAQKLLQLYLWFVEGDCCGIESRSGRCENQRLGSEDSVYVAWLRAKWIKTYRTAIKGPTLRIRCFWENRLQENTPDTLKSKLVGPCMYFCVMHVVLCCVIYVILCVVSCMNLFVVSCIYLVLCHAWISVSWLNFCVVSCLHLCVLSCMHPVLFRYLTILICRNVINVFTGRNRIPDLH